MAGPTIISVQKIWDRGAHNAFTDLARFQGKWFCAFREAQAHADGEGKIRILQSRDGAAWASAALLSEKGVDLRDPKLSVTPDRRLMLLMGGTFARGRAGAGRQPRVAFSHDALLWGRPQPVLSEGDWLWRVTWRGSRAYGISYRLLNAGTWRIFLYESADGKDYRLVCPLNVPGKPNESTIRFRPDGTAVALVRREGGDKDGWIGTGRPPYEKWEWRSAGVRVGGPNFIVQTDGRLVAACRQYGKAGPVTVLAWLKTTGLRPFLALPSSGDCSYPGLVAHRGPVYSFYVSIVFLLFRDTSVNTRSDLPVQVVDAMEGPMKLLIPAFPVLLAAGAIAFGQSMMSTGNSNGSASGMTAPNDSGGATSMMSANGDNSGSATTMMSAKPMMADPAVGNKLRFAPSTGTKVFFTTLEAAEALAARQPTVLFFAADWCPYCQADLKDINANGSRLGNVAVVVVNYDTEKKLKAQYGITAQDTFVQIDSSGAMKAIWRSGGGGVTDILSHIVG